MKKINIILSASMFSLFTFTISCKKLDKFPHDNIELSKSFESIKDAQTWNNGVYAHFRGRVYGIYTFATDLQADQLNATLDFGNRNGAPHRWGDTFLADDYTIRDIWQGFYKSITNINIILDGYTKIKPKDDAETKLLNQYTGDAYLARAYYYLQLALRWSKSYSPATANTDLSVPLVLKYDFEDKPARATLKEVYTQILADIEKAKPLLSATTGAKGAARFNKDVATALEARIKLYMQDFSGAASAADQLINSNTYPLITTKADFKKMWENDFAQEVIFQSFVKAPSELANANGIYLGYNGASKKYTPDFLPSKWVVDMYEDADIRKSVYFANVPIVIQGKDYTNLYVVNKFPGNPSLFTGATTNYQQAPKVFRIAEMYLVSAEATVISNPAASLKTLNTLRAARGLLPLLNLTGDALMNAVKEERFRELAFEGFRLDDLKRWKQPVQRKDPQSLDPINVGANYNTLNKSADDNQIVWGLPTNDVTLNEKLKQNQNPGW